LNHDRVFRLVGALNKRFNLIESVFLMYPANDEYALAYAYPSRLRKNRWNPWLCGVLVQNGRLGVQFAISANNGQFTDLANTDNLLYLAHRMDQIRILLGANRRTFAGILPGVLYYKRIIREAAEADLTAEAVVQAIGQVKARESLGSDTPIIVLGGKGFIGRRVVKLLGRENTHSIDSAVGQGSDDWPKHLRGPRAIVLNITLNNALEDYVDVIWPGTVVINEVYPEPSPKTLERLRHCACYHVVGVSASSFPSFPAAYEGAIPCCAAWPAPGMKVVVKKLN
jgi:hypothetical protein